MNKPNHAIVVGGTKGLGKVVTERFLARGCNVTVLARNQLPQENHPRIRFVQVDLENLVNLEELVTTIIEPNGPCRYIVFCQRYRGTGDPWLGEMQVTLTASQQLIEAFSKHFCSEGDKAIGVVSSVYADFVGGSQPVGYHVAKAGLNQLIRFYACSLGKKGIRVNGIMPLTYLKNESRQYYMSNQPLLDLYEKLIPLKRMGDAEDSANLLDFLCSDKAAFINGQNIYVDGGVSVTWQEEIAKTVSGL